MRTSDPHFRVVQLHLADLERTVERGRGESVVPGALRGVVAKLRRSAR